MILISYDINWLIKKKKHEKGIQEERKILENNYVRLTRRMIL